MGSITLQAVSEITPDLRASCTAPNPPFLDFLPLARSFQSGNRQLTASDKRREGDIVQSGKLMELYKNLATKIPVDYKPCNMDVGSQWCRIFESL